MCIRDSTNRVKRTDPGNPENCNFFPLHKIFSPQETQKEVIESCTNASIGCVDCKNMLTPNLMEKINPIHEKRNQYLKDKDNLKDILNAGTEKARSIALPTINEVKERMKLTS